LLLDRDFFSRFCFYVRDVSKDGSQLESELRRIDCHLQNAGSLNIGNNLFLCGPKPSLLDCEVLPKLHQVRVAAAGIKGLCNFLVVFLLKNCKIHEFPSVLMLVSDTLLAPCKALSASSILYKLSVNVVEVVLVSRGVHLTIIFIKFSLNICIRQRLYWTNVN
jgi:hypothetical protein